MPILATRPAPPPVNYTQTADTVLALPRLMREARASGLTIKLQAKAVGVTATTLTRLDAGSVPTQTTIVACLRWLARN